VVPRAEDRSQHHDELPLSTRGVSSRNDHNPDHVESRNLFNIAIGTDNLLHKEGARRYTASIEVTNLTNKVALYNFLSTFGGTHFPQPRTVLSVLIRFSFFVGRFDSA
jgi:hypothetical protein